MLHMGLNLPETLMKEVAAEFFLPKVVIASIIQCHFLQLKGGGRSFSELQHKMATSEFNTETDSLQSLNQ